MNSLLKRYFSLVQGYWASWLAYEYFVMNGENLAFVFRKLGELPQMFLMSLVLFGNVLWMSLRWTTSLAPMSRAPANMTFQFLKPSQPVKANPSHRTTPAAFHSIIWEHKTWQAALNPGRRCTDNLSLATVHYYSNSQIKLRICFQYRYIFFQSCSTHPTAQPHGRVAWQKYLPPPPVTQTPKNQ